MGQTFWQLPQATHSVLFTTACRFGKVVLLLILSIILQYYKTYTAGKATQKSNLHSASCFCVR